MLRQIALVTGAASSRGIGRSIALRLAHDGLNVAVNDLSSRRHELDDVVTEINRTAAPSQRAVAVAGDASSEADVEAMVAAVAEQLGGLDVMVANAGILRVAELTDSSPGTVEKWDETMSVNLRSVMLSYRYAAMQMIRQGRGGRIIGASSFAGKRGIGGGVSAYVASKFGVRGLTQSAADTMTALDLVEVQLIFCVYTHFGLTVTTQHAGLPPDMPSAGPEVVASLVSYLVKPEAYFITGQTINVSGGIFFD
ncbi:hypothetical protein C8Q72DRAFT_941322 [Fomitopsis betulina]|nr:hypothetical protein C8Q72DRAFT_941322 [Fomitopsis betulina]